MTGEDLKNKLKGAGFFPSNIAKDLGMSHQAMSVRLAAKDVKLSFLYEICKVTGLELSYFINVPSPSDVSNLIDMIKEKDKIIMEQAIEIGKLQEKLAKSK